MYLLFCGLGKAQDHPPTTAFCKFDLRAEPEGM